MRRRKPLTREEQRMLKLAAGRQPTEPDEPERDLYETLQGHYGTAPDETMRSARQNEFDRSLERAEAAMGGGSVIPRKSGILKNAPQERSRDTKGGGARSLSERKRG